MKFEIKERHYSYESRGYDKDSTMTSYSTAYDVFRNGKLVDSFHSPEAARKFINSKSATGKKLVDKIKRNESKVKKLEREIARINSESIRAMRKLESKNLR